MELVATGPPLELVEWRDACFFIDEPDEDPEDYICRTVGWVYQLPLFLKVVSEFTAEDGKKAVTYIPNEMVVRRTNLKDS